MMFKQDSAEIFVPDGLPAEEALKRTTHLGIAAHQDDIEIMASAPILACLHDDSKWFTGVVVTDGRGSPRAGIYENYRDAEMRLVRRKEQKKAAVIGEYAAVVFLDYESKELKGGGMKSTVEDLLDILLKTRPEQVYTHNPADKHDTHVAVTIGVIEAIRRLPEKKKPMKLYGCEVWRDLDWLLDEDKIVFDLSAHENLQVALLGIFDSQIAGGKRYDLATLGRRKAHGTFFESHEVDESQSMMFGMDLTPLIQDVDLTVSAYVGELIRRFGEDVKGRIERISKISGKTPNPK